MRRSQCGNIIGSKEDYPWSLRWLVAASVQEACLSRLDAMASLPVSHELSRAIRCCCGVFGPDVAPPASSRLRIVAEMTIDLRRRHGGDIEIWSEQCCNGGAWMGAMMPLSPPMFCTSLWTLVC